MNALNQPLGHELRVRWRRFLEQTGLPPLWLLALLFSGAIGAEVLRAHDLVVPWMEAAWVFIIAGVGTALAGQSNGERARLFLPCLWMIGSVVLGVVALQQWYIREPLEKDFHAWIRDGLLADWSFQRLVFGRAAAGRDAHSLSYLLALPVLAVPGVLGFAAFRKREMTDQPLWTIPPSASFKIFVLLMTGFFLVTWEMLLTLSGAAVLLLRPAASIPGTEWRNHARRAGLVWALLFSAALALLALNTSSSLQYGTEGSTAGAARHIWENRLIFIGCVLELPLILLALGGSHLARRGALVLTALAPALLLAYALLSSQGLIPLLTNLNGFSALALAYLPLSKKDLAAPAAPAGALAPP
jgi:hypothetical protein